MLSALPSEVTRSADVLAALLDVSLTGTALLQPVFSSPNDSSGTIEDFACVYLNPAAQRLCQLPERPRGTWRTLFPAAASPGILRVLDETYRSGEAGTWSVGYLRGQARRAGELLVLSFMATAPTEAHSAPEPAPEGASAGQLQQFAESAPSTTFTVEASGRVVYVSPQWYAYTGMAPDAPVAEAWPALIHPDDLPAVAAEYGSALAGGRAWRYEFRLRGADGHYRWFTSQGVPEPLAEAQAAGRPRRWYGSNLDIDDLKQAQLRLEQQDQQLADILSALPAGVVTFDAEELRYQFFNDTFQQQVQGRAVLGRRLTELFPEAEEQGFIDLLRQVLHTSQPYVLHELPSYLRDPHTGEEQAQFTDVAYVPLRHGSAPPYGVLGFSIDATERVLTRRQTEAAQAQAVALRETFYQLFRQTPACVALLRGPAHRFEYVNEAYQQLFPDRQLQGRTVAEALPESIDQGFLELLNRVFQTGETFFGQEVPFTRQPAAGQPGQDFYFDFTYQVIREGDTVAGISIFAFDVTERVRARREREAQREQLHALFQQSPAPLVIFDGPDLVYQLANPAYQRIFPGRELQGKPLLEALPELAGNPLIDELRHAYATGQTYVARELPLQLARSEGGPLEEIYWTFTYQPRRNAAGEVNGVLVFAADVTDQVRARRVVEEGAQRARAHAEQLQAANQQLTRANAELDTFVYTASHDLKTPISNIEGLVLALREDLALPAAEQPDLTGLLDLMQESVDRFKRTLAHLADVTRLQQSLITTQVAGPVALAPVVEAVRQDLLPQLQATRAELAVDVAACPVVSLPEQHVRSIVFNLLSNALKYRHPSRAPQVQLRSYPEAGYAVLEVRDNGLGLGLDPTQQHKMFGLFQRLHDHVEGSGVGLYVVRKIVDNAGGRVEVEGQPGHGATFRVYLPT